MAEAFRITQEIDFFDVDDYEERAATYESLHSAATRSMRDDRLRRVAALLGAVGFLALFWSVTGGPGTEAQASAPAVTAPSELEAAPGPGPEATPVLHFAAGPPPWAIARGFDVLASEPEEILEAELSANLLAKLSAPPPAKAKPAPVRRAAAPAPPRTEAPPAAKRKAKAAPSRSQSLEIAVTLHDEGRSDEALRVLRKLGNNPEALVLKGSIYQDKGDPVAAREVYETYLQRHPSGAHVGQVRSILGRL